MIALTLGGSGLSAHITPSSFSEASKAQFGAMPGIRWCRASGRYEGPEEALRLVAAKLEAAGVAVLKGRFELSGTVSTAPAQFDWSAEIRDYQKDGAAWVRWMLKATGGALLGDEMGIGKTAQAIMALEASEGPLLVLAPAIAVPHWAGQIRRWSPKGQEPGRWLVMSPEKFQREWTKEASDVRKLAFAAVVLDEIHYYANPTAKRSKAVAGLLDSASVRPGVIGLSGTPLQTRVRDLWHVLELLWPGRFGAKFNFEKRYCAGHFEEIEGLERPIWKSEGSSYQEELAVRLAPCMLRRTKDQVALELPSLTRDIREIELPSKARSSERKLAGASWESQAQGIDALLNACESYKVEAVVELAQECLAAGSRPLILARTREVANLIGAALGCPVATGDVPASERRARLLSGEGAAVSTIYAVTTGIDLTEFDCAIFTGPDWVPSNLMQAEARIHRLGQSKPVTIYYLVGIGTVDETIRERVIDRLEIFAKLTRGAGDESQLAAEFSGGSDEVLLQELASEILGKKKAKK